MSVFNCKGYIFYIYILNYFLNDYVQVRSAKPITLAQNKLFKNMNQLCTLRMCMCTSKRGGQEGRERKRKREKSQLYILKVNLPACP